MFNLLKDLFKSGEEALVVDSRGHGRITFEEVVSSAVAIGAYVPNNDEAGDDSFRIKFPTDSEPRLYTEDQLRAAVRRFNDPDSGVE